MSQWWKDKIIYQIWPKSFNDSNGDGIGDIQGIVERLDYLKDLGVDIIWLSPVYASPFVDQGYDISDYQSIHPAFGTIQDMDYLLREMERRDMYLIMDLVVNHCSDEHIWFKKACQDPLSVYGKYFYIVPKKDGIPSNVRGYFGGSVWDELPGNPDYLYYHSFHKRQPDLNWENPFLRKEIYYMIDWWLKRGVAGFRIDAIMNIKKDLPFHNYEADREDGMASILNVVQESEGIGDFLTEMKKETFEKYDAFTVGEVFHEKESELGDFIGTDGYFSTMFDFGPELIGKADVCYEYAEVTPKDYKETIFASQKRMESIGLLANIIENHDEMRGVSRYIPEGDLCDASKKALAAVYFFLKGIPVIYQGQEIGMENCPFRDLSEIEDVSTINDYEVALEAGLSEEEAFRCAARYSRDNARTPVQWSDDINAGFTNGSPWFGINPDYKRINARAQLADEHSVLQFYQKMIQLRKDPDYEDIFVEGKFEPLYEDVDNVIAYYRIGEGRRALLLSNYQRKERELMLPVKPECILLNNMDHITLDGNRIHLDGYQTVILLETN